MPEEIDFQAKQIRFLHRTVKTCIPECGENSHDVHLVFFKEL